MMFDIGRNMFMMWMCDLKCWVIGMGLRIVPIQLLVGLPGFVAIAIDDHREAIKRESFTDDQTDISIEIELAGDPRQCCTVAHKDQGRATNRGKLFGKRVDEQ